MTDEEYPALKQTVGAGKGPPSQSKTLF